MKISRKQIKRENKNKMGKPSLRRYEEDERQIGEKSERHKNRRK